MLFAKKGSNGRAPQVQKYSCIQGDTAAALIYDLRCRVSRGCRVQSCKQLCGRPLQESSNRPSLRSRGGRLQTPPLALSCNYDDEQFAPHEQARECLRHRQSTSRRARSALCFIGTRYGSAPSRESPERGSCPFLAQWFPKDPTRSGSFGRRRRPSGEDSRPHGAAPRCTRIVHQIGVRKPLQIY